jgi:hypothetical protein
MQQKYGFYDSLEKGLSLGINENKNIKGKVLQTRYIRHDNRLMSTSVDFFPFLC